MATRKKRSPVSGRKRPRPVPAGLSSDWYWEQDATLRFVRLDVPSGAAGEQELAQKSLGRRPWETGISVDGGWQAHRALLKARAPFREVLMWRDFEDGSRRYIRVSGEPVFDAGGAFAGYRGIGRDITRHKRGEQLLHLQQTVTRVLAEAPGAAQGAEGALRAICEAEGWDYGELWRLDAAQSAMRRFACWAMPGVAASQPFVDIPRDFEFRRGEGLVGAVWESGAPLWIPDVTRDARAARRSIAEQTGLHAALVCPIHSAGGVAGVLGFACCKIRPPDEDLQQALMALATQLGLYLRRADTEARLRESEERFRSLTELSSDWFWEQDAQYRFTRLEGRNVGGGDAKMRQEVIGTRCWEGELEVEGGWQAYRGLLEARSPFHDLLMWRPTSDGAMRYVRVSGEPVFDAGGRFAGYRGVGRDVTGPNRAEQLLRLEHHVARAAADAEDTASGLQAILRAVCEVQNWISGCYFRADEESGVLSFQEGWSTGEPAGLELIERSRALTYRPGEGLLGLCWQSAQPVWSADTLQDPRVAVRSLPESTGIRGAFVFAAVSEGRPLGVLSFASPAVRQPDERLLQSARLIGSQAGQFLRRMRAEESLRDSEARFRHTFELAGVGVAHIGLDRRFQRVNRRFCEILGYPEAELIGRTGRDISHPEDLDAMNAQRPDLYAGRIDAVRGEKRYLRKDGSVVWVAYTLAIERDAAGNPHHEIAVYDDVSGRKAAESALRDSEARFRSLTELSSDWFWELDAEYRFTRLEGRSVTGGDNALRERLIGTRRWDSGLQIEGGWEAHRALLEARKSFQDVLMWRSLSDGSLRYVSVSGEPLFAADGRFAGYRGVGRDVTQHRRGEQLLRLEHQVVRALAEAQDEAGGLRAVLRAVCEEERWSCGRFFRLDEARDEMRFEEGWGIEGPGIAAFLAASRDMRLGRGQGLIGHAWEHGEAAWASDTAKDPRSLAQGLRFAGLHGAFVFPVISAGRVLGVCAFISDQAREPDERLLLATRVLGTQMGQFLERKRAEEALRESEARFRALTEMSSDFFWETDAQHRLTATVYGQSLSGKMDDALGKAPWDVPSIHPDQAGWAALRAKVERHLPFRDFEFGRPRADGGVRYFSVSGEPRLASDGGFLGYRGVGRNITELVLARERIASLAYQDPLTGLANRTSLAPALEQAVERARRRGSKLAGVFLDLDGFKQINDLHGHDAGDRLLVELAQRLRAALRSSDPVARLGGDEFFVVLEDLQSNAPAERVADKLLATVMQPYDIGGGKQAHISASIGISLFPDDAGDATTLMKHADAAMYCAKQAGKNAYRFFVSGPAANDGRTASEEKTL
jgi:diguanylate cyclase (GGDEF)-like protein/PAS domain S-box-containing protein